MWKPLSESQLDAMIEEAELFMSVGCRRFWEQIKLSPQKWKQSPWGDQGGGFWTVAVIGNTCIYYNDIEEGFNLSTYSTFGYIDEYGCNQSDLLPTVESFYSEVFGEIVSDIEQALGADSP